MVDHLADKSFMRELRHFLEIGKQGVVQYTKEFYPVVASAESQKEIRSLQPEVSPRGSLMTWPIAKPTYILLMVVHFHVVLGKDG